MTSGHDFCACRECVIQRLAHAILRTDDSSKNAIPPICIKRDTCSTGGLSLSSHVQACMLQLLTI